MMNFAEMMLMGMRTVLRAGVAVIEVEVFEIDARILAPGAG
jgi:hypothetical protein